MPFDEGGGGAEFGVLLAVIFEKEFFVETRELLVIEDVEEIHSAVGLGLDFGFDDEFANRDEEFIRAVLASIATGPGDMVIVEFGNVGKIRDEATEALLLGF